MSSIRRTPRPSTPPTRRPKVAGAPRGIAAKTAAEQAATSPATPDTAAPDTAGSEEATTAEPRSPRKFPFIKRGAGFSLRPQQPEGSQQPEAAESAAESETEPGGRTAGSRLSWKLVTVLGVVAVLLGAFATIAAFKPGAGVSNKAYVDNAVTDEVKAAAQNAMVTLYAYNEKNIDKYPDAARSVLTDDMRKDFDKSVKTTVDGVKQAKTTVDAQVDPIGVTVLTHDSGLDHPHNPFTWVWDKLTHHAPNRAELLANLTVSAANNGVAQGSASGPEVVRMQKVDGKWLISGIIDR